MFGLSPDSPITLDRFVARIHEEDRAGGPVDPNSGQKQAQKVPPSNQQG